MAVLLIYQLKGRLTQNQTISPEQAPNAGPGIEETFSSRVKDWENRLYLYMYYLLIIMHKIKKGWWIWPQYIEIVNAYLFWKKGL